MHYQSDYVLRLVEQMGGLVRRALQLARIGNDGESYDVAAEAIGLALDVDPVVAAKLSPHSLAAMLEMSNLDARVIRLVADALEVQADVLEQAGEIVEAGVRRQQATAVLGLLDPGHAN